MRDHLHLSQLPSHLPLVAFASFAAFATFACSVADSYGRTPHAVPAFPLAHRHGGRGSERGYESAGTPAMRRHGFAVGDEGLKVQIEESACIGGGQCFDAAGSDELDDTIAAALQPPFEFRATAGALIGSGVVDGDPARVPPGTYTVEVQSDPPRDFPDIVVGNGEELVLSLLDIG